MKLSLSTTLLVEEAKRRGIKVTIEHYPMIIRLEYKDHVDYLFHQFISSQGYVSSYVCLNKDVAKKYFILKNLPVAVGGKFKLSKKNEIIDFCNSTGWPVVLKPCDGTHGKDVYLSLGDEQKLLDKIKILEMDATHALVEKMHFGQEYRILATRDKVVGIINRVPANVVGDGNKTIQQLIDQKNSDPRRINKQALVLIEIDDSVLEYLNKQGKTLETVPAPGETVFLRENSNLSTGGDSIDCTDIAHDSVKEIAMQAIEAVPGLLYGGVDFLTEDITKDQKDLDHIIIEINSRPMISMHHFPLVGKSRDVAAEIFNLAFPETKGNR